MIWIMCSMNDVLASTRCLNNSNDLCLLSLWVPCLKQLVAVHLVDAHLCSDPGKYVSALLLSLSTMLHMELPHVNVLSKIDLIENYGKLGMFAAFLFPSSFAPAFGPEQTDHAPRSTPARLPAHRPAGDQQHPPAALYP